MLLTMSIRKILAFHSLRARSTERQHEEPSCHPIRPPRFSLSAAREPKASLSFVAWSRIKDTPLKFSRVTQHLGEPNPYWRLVTFPSSKAHSPTRLCCARDFEGVMARSLISTDLTPAKKPKLIGRSAATRSPSKRGS